MRQEYPYFVGFVHFNYFASIIASLLSLSALSIDRLIAVRFPMRYRSNVSFTRYGIVALIIWIVAYGLSGMYFVIGYVMMLMVMASISCLFTLIVMLACYFLLYLVIKHREDALNASLDADAKRAPVKQIATGSDEGAASAASNTPREEPPLVKLKKSQNATTARKIVGVLLVMLVLFLVCFVPATIMIFIINLEQGDCIFRHWLRDLQLLFCISSSLVNPFIYTLRLPNFKRAIYYVLRIKTRLEVAVIINVQ